MGLNFYGSVGNSRTAKFLVGFFALVFTVSMTVQPLVFTVLADHDAGAPYAGQILGANNTDGATIDKIRICHTTGSDTNIYTNPDVNINSFFSGGHDTDLNDVIPPFHYDLGNDEDEPVVSFPGMNWTGNFITTWQNNCSDPVSTATPTVTPTTTPTVTPTPDPSVSPTVTLTAIPTTTPTPTPTPEPEEFPGSVTICKVVADNTVGLGTTFTISSNDPAVTSVTPAIGTFATSVFTMPLNLNSDLLSDIQGDDAECKTYNNLPLGSYYYSEETIDGSGDWEVPRYNDQFNHVLITVADFLTWDDNLYDGDLSNDDPNFSGRNENSDGHFWLKAERPHRTIVVFNELAVEADNLWTLTITTNGDGNGVITGDGINCDSNPPTDENDCTNTYPDGTAVTLTVLSDEGSNFDNSWTTVLGNPGACTANTTPCQVTMSGNVTLNAHFGITTTTTITTTTVIGCTSNCGGGGGGGGGGSFVPLASPTPTPSVVPTPVPQVLGATTVLPETGFSFTERMMMSLFTSFTLTGMMMLMIGYGMVPAKLENYLN